MYEVSKQISRNLFHEKLCIFLLKEMGLNKFLHLKRGGRLITDGFFF